MGSSVAAGGPGCGAVAAGGLATTSAGAEALAAGGNAVDAVLAATVASTVAEQTLASLGGGGFLIVRTADGQVHLRDFFVDTPGRGLPADQLDLHFLPMVVDYTSTTQTFHVGLGSAAVPGLLAGILAAHEEFARLPLAALVAPAQRYAAGGVEIPPSQAEVLALTRELMALSPESRRLVQRDGRWLDAGDLVLNPDFARFLGLVADGSVDSMASAGFAGPLLELMAGGGLITATDLDAYEVLARAPVTVERAGHVLHTNAPPSFGGSIIAETLAGAPRLDPRSPHSWVALARTLVEATAKVRATATVPLTSTGTTHASAVDSDGMVASMTTSNGVTSGYVIPGTGIQLNNMLGEADLNPDGFHATPPGQRMGSMMSPSILELPDGGVVGIGSGGSERIRSCMSEALLRLIDAGQPLAEAVSGARIHPDDSGLHVEPHLGADAIEGIRADVGPSVNVWPEASLFFGGVNAVQRMPDGSVRAVADGRRGGGALVVGP